MISLLIRETSAVTSDFNHLSEYYVNYVSTDLLAQMMGTQSDGVQTMVDRVVNSDPGTSFK